MHARFGIAFPLAVCVAFSCASDDKTLARVDQYGDPLPEGAVARLGTVRFRCGGRIGDLAFSADGKTLVGIGYNNSAVCIWDTFTGCQRLRIQPYAAIHVACSRDGRMLAVGHNDDRPRCLLYDASTGKEMHRVPDLARCFGVAISPDAKLLAATDDSLRLYDLSTGIELRQIEEQGAFFHKAVFAPDGKRLAVYSFPNQIIHLREVPSLKPVATLEGHEQNINSFAFSPDGARIASVSEDKTLRIWDAVTGTQLYKLAVDKRGIEAVAFAPDSKVVASAGADQMVRLWDVATGQEIRRVEDVGYVHSLAFSADGKTLAVGALAIRFFDPATGAELQPLNAPYDFVWHAAFTPDAKTVITADGALVRFWRVGDWKEEVSAEKPIRTKFQSRIIGFALSSDGTTLATSSVDGPILLSDAATGKELRVLKGHDDRVAPLLFSPDGKTLFSASRDKTLRAWQVDTGLEICQFKGHRGWIGPVAVSADGRILAAADYDYQDRQEPTIFLWDTRTGQELRRIFIRGEQVSELAFSADGSTLGGVSFANESLGAPCRLRLWEVASGNEVHRPFEPHWQSPRAHISRDGRTFVGGYGGRDVLLWELASGKVRQRFTGHQGQALPVAFSPDGKRLVSGSFDTTALIWDLSPSATLPPAKAPDLPMLWADLAATDAEKAYQAIQRLAATPTLAVQWLGQRLQPVRVDVPDRISRLIRDLDSDSFAVRQKAQEELPTLGDGVAPALERALADGPSLEARRRIEQILPMLRPAASPDGLRRLRAVEVLERIGTAEAQQVLKSLADGLPDAWLTQDAKASLDRLRK